MLATPDLPVDYLKVPANQRVANAKPHRSSSFNIQSNQSDERIASNLSLSSVGNGILKAPNSFRRRQSTASRLSVHYTPVANGEEDQIEFIPSLIVPTIDSSSFIENTQTNNRHPLKIPTHYGFHGKSNWSNVFFKGRSIEGQAL